MTTYADFLASKRRTVGAVGPAVDAGDLHPSLFDFQRAITTWAVRKGRAAVLADTGLGKTRVQLEWARHVAPRVLILAPLTVARQTAREAEAVDMDVPYVRSPDAAKGPGVWITNYEMAHHFDPDDWDGVVLDESSILKNVDGKTRRHLTATFGRVKYRLACTATPAPNDVGELTNHAEYLGAMSRRDMLASFFIHDDAGWRLKGHARKPLFEWMASWAVALRHPSDLGYSDEGYRLPPLRIHAQPVEVYVDAPGRLFATELGGIGGRAAVRRATLDARLERAASLAEAPGQHIIWCGLNDEADGVAKLVDGAVNVPGSWAPEAKAEALEAFQDEQLRVLVSKPSVCGFGMNFQQCASMVFLGLSDSFEAYYQCIRRCWRFGQARPVDVHIVVSELEQEIVENVRRKEQEASRMTADLVAAIAREFQG